MAGNRAGKIQGAKFYQHNPQVTLMRTTPAECAQLGRIIAEKLNLSNGPVTVLIPVGHQRDQRARPEIHDPAADQSLFDALKAHLRNDIAVIEMDCAINDAEFAERARRRCETHGRAQMKFRPTATEWI